MLMLDKRNTLDVLYSLMQQVIVLPGPCSFSETLHPSLAKLDELHQWGPQHMYRGSDGDRQGWDLSQKQCAVLRMPGTRPLAGRWAACFHDETTQWLAYSPENACQGRN